MYSPCLFYLTTSLKLEEIQLTVVYDKEKDQILTFEQLETANVSFFA